MIDKEIIDKDGTIMSFSNDMVIRYLENVKILDHEYEVIFKGGLTVTVGMNSGCKNKAV